MTRLEKVKANIEKKEKIEKLKNSISMAQCRILIERHGLTNEVDSYIANSENSELKIAWEYATRLARTHSLFTEVAVSLGFTEPEIDNMYLEALEVDVL